MTLDQFKQELVKLGYKMENYENGMILTTYHYKNRSNTISLQIWHSYTNVFFERKTANGDYEYNQRRVTDFKKALSNILKFERKIK